MSLLAFSSYALNGVDAQRFLQGQVTVDTERLAENETRYTAICDLKGRIHFGLWLKRIMQKVLTLLSLQDQAEEFAKHIKKYGAFSKMTLSEQGAVFPKVVNGHTEFSSTETDISEWQNKPS